MSKPRGPHGSSNSQVVCVRMPRMLAEQVFQSAGADRGSELAEFLRNLLRRSVGVPLDFEAGYSEGKAQGWHEAQESFKDAMRGVKA